MKKVILPVLVFIAGLAVAKIFFHVDIEGLAEGFFDFLKDLFDGPG